VIHNSGAAGAGLDWKYQAPAPNIAAIISPPGGRAAVDPFTIVISIALLATVGALLLGVLVMSGGGNTDATASTPLMWVRVGLQALTILLLFLALLMRR